MIRTRTRFMGAASVALTMLLAACVGPVIAQQPEPQLRYFAVLLWPHETPPPDLLGSDSKLLFVHDTGSTGSVAFCEQAPSELLAGTQWYRAETMHVTKGGAEWYPTFWLGGRPDDGAMAWTGPEGDAEILYGPFYVRLGSGSSGDCSTTDWTVDDQPSTFSYTWYVGKGWFSK